MEANIHNSHTHGHGAGHSHYPWYVMPAVSLALLIAGMILHHCGAAWFSGLVQPLWYLVAFLPVGLPVCREAVASFRSHDWFNEFMLMVIASIGAFCIGEYPEAVGVMLFYSIGESLQDRAVDRATRNISRLVGVRVEHARVIRDGAVTEVPPRDVSVGETIEVLPGQRVPLDGVLEGAGAMFDTSALTGESVPRRVEKGGEVLAGMIAVSQAVRIRTTKVYGESALARIMQMVSEASARKAHTELFIRRFAHVYTPVVIALAALLVAVPALVGWLHPAYHYVFSDWLYRGLVFLVVSCPCALVISVPLGYFAGIGAASRLGVLFKGGNYLEAVARLDEVAFDKTGTLTTGRFSVERVESPLLPEAGMLALMAGAEAGSTHPLAKALTAYVRGRGIAVGQASQLTETPGQGTQALIEGRAVAAGNVKMLRRLGVDFPPEIERIADTVILCAVDGRYAGYVCLADTLKPDAREAVDRLHELGIQKVVMLSGDKKEIVDEFARRLGMSEAHGEMLPQDKAAYVESAAGRKDHTIAFVGDGMNDAPVLAVSDVGIAMGALGSDAAIESADVVIETDRPSRVATAVEIGRATHAIVMENIIGAIGVKVVVLALGALGWASLWAAVFADVGVALLAVLNSMRIMWKKYS